MIVLSEQSLHNLVSATGAVIESAGDRFIVSVSWDGNRSYLHNTDGDIQLFESVEAALDEIRMFTEIKVNIL